MRVLEHDGSVALSVLARKLDVSLETIRRDIKPLAESGSLIKMHGAVGLASTVGEAPFERRMRENSEAKRAIAAAVAIGLLIDHTTPRVPQPLDDET